jgi:hypothetical protein
MNWEPTKEDLDWTKRTLKMLEGQCKKPKMRMRWGMASGELGLDFKTKEYAVLDMKPMFSEQILRAAKCLEELGWVLTIGENTIRI